MHLNHNRTVKVNKADLISKIEENKLTHVKEYEQAVIDYREEAQRQITQIQKELTDGSLKIKLNLITPVNRSEEYDKVIEMFKWEVEEIIEVTQKEFNEYVHDDNDSARNAKFLNSSYSQVR